VSGGREELDRHEPATPYKLEKAHERGSVVRSTDVTFAAVLLAAVGLVYAVFEQTLHRVARVFASALSAVGKEELSPSGALGLVGQLFEQAGNVVAPLFAVLWVVAVGVAALQVQGVLSAEPITPDFKRLNPMTGLKRLFSVRSLHELLRSSLKLSVLAVAVFLWGRAHATEVLMAGFKSPAGLTHLTVVLLGSFLAMCAALFVVFAALDYGFNRWEFLRQMRMSVREIKDEHKNREGDPRIKSRLRELRARLAKQARSVARVKDADVLLTNPTHYAVALRYEHQKMSAPMVLAKGRGELAAGLRASASKHGIPVVVQPALTRRLFAAAEEDQVIPEAEFVEVARILRWVYAGRRAANPQRGLGT
jgi:flagellar biosynthesis protein FlhB